MARQPNSRRAPDADDQTAALAGNSQPSLPLISSAGGGGSGLLPPKKTKTTYNATEQNHLIADHELEQLSSASTGDMGSWFFCALGAFLGSIVSFLDRLDKVNNPDSPIHAGDLVVIGLTIAFLVAALILGSIWKARVNSGRKLVAEIRSRRSVSSTR